MAFANPAIADKVVERRIHDAEADYLTYCAMCRDKFAAKGKRAFHMLDLIYGSSDGGSSNGDAGDRKGPSYSQRHENRAKLKSRLLADLWGENVAVEEDPIKLLVSPEVSELMEKRMILAEDIRKVIAHAESTGEKMENPATGTFLASYRPVAVTYWVEYSVVDDGFAIRNVYSHRMEVS